MLLESMDIDSYGTLIASMRLKCKYNFRAAFCLRYNFRLSKVPPRGTYTTSLESTNDRVLKAWNHAHLSNWFLMESLGFPANRKRSLFSYAILSNATMALSLYFSQRVQ